MEIERKFLIGSLEDVPGGIERYPFHDLEQGYLCTNPVVRVRKEDDEYYMTYKGRGMMAREEYNLPLTKEAYEQLIQKADGIVITKRRYFIPLDCPNAVGSNTDSVGKDNLVCELDVFDGHYAGILLAEVEFPSEEDANSFMPPAWFGEDVTYDPRYHNSNMSKGMGPKAQNH